MTTFEASEARAKEVMLSFLRVYSKKFSIKVRMKRFLEKCKVLRVI